VTVERFAQLRYQNQEHTTEVALTAADLETDQVAALIERFHVQYEAEYTYRLDAAVEFVGIHLVALADVGRPQLTEQPLGESDAAAAKIGQRSVDFATEGTHTADRYQAEQLTPGMTISGPAVVEGAGTSVLIHPGCTASIDGFRNIHIDLG
jgi:N-methylhydantoinase A